MTIQGIAPARGPQNDFSRQSWARASFEDEAVKYALDRLLSLAGVTQSEIPSLLASTIPLEIELDVDRGDLLDSFADQVISLLAALARQTAFSHDNCAALVRLAQHVETVTLAGPICRRQAR
ncbi:MAG: hypothetical protein KDA42_17630 [Planctomycetales bacterium]|nr:hypothetical protein [Planctomycetales bacterium]